MNDTPHNSMRGYFAWYLYKAMETNPDIYVVVGDLGYAMLDDIRQDFPDRFINTGAAEQAMIGIACGLALSGKIPVVYSITPFLIYRPFETIRNYVNNEKLNVKLIGSGRNNDYAHDGFSHDASDVKPILDNFRNITQHYPETKEEMEYLVPAILSHRGADFVSLSR